MPDEIDGPLEPGTPTSVPVETLIRDAEQTRRQIKAAVRDLASADEDATAEDASEESAEFLTALINGTVAGGEKIIKLVNIRFNTLSRRQREDRQLLREIMPLVHEVRLVRRLLLAGVPIAFGLGTTLGTIIIRYWLGA